MQHTPVSETTAHHTLPDAAPTPASGAGPSSYAQPPCVAPSSASVVGSVPVAACDFTPQWKIRTPVPPVFAGAFAEDHAASSGPPERYDPQDLPKILYYPGALRPNIPVHGLVGDLRFLVAAVRTANACEAVLLAAGRVEDYARMLHRTGSHMIVPLDLSPTTRPPVNAEGEELRCMRIV